VPRLRERTFGLVHHVLRSSASQAPQRHRGRRIAELALGPQHEHRQPLQRGRQQVGAAGQQQIALRIAPDHERGQEPPLG
jgi:hypothetical protein